MTNVILTSIGILLASATVLMAVFYGGDAFTSSQLKAEAARLTTEGQQIQNAISNFKVRYGRRPGNGGTHEQVINELIATNFLESVPPGSANSWVIDYQNGLIRSNVGPSNNATAQRICREARAQQKLANPDRIYRCNGSDHPAGRLPANEPCCIFQ